MRQYELTTVLPGNATEAEEKKFAQKVEKLVSGLGGSVEKMDLWGKKNLSYSIKKNTSGLYYFLNINLPEDQASVLNREVELDEEVIRHLLVVASGKSQVSSTKEQTNETKITKRQTRKKKS